MKNLLILFLASVMAASCGGADSENANSVINGKWASSTCLQIDLPFTEYNSFKNVMDIKDGSISNKLYQYTDTECSDLGSIVDNGLFANLFDRYNVGNSVTLENGDIVKEIDFFDSHDNLLPDIYLLTESNLKLNLGIKDLQLIDPCPLNRGDAQDQIVTDGDVVFGGETSCWTWTSRPIEINYNEAFTKLSE